MKTEIYAFRINLLTSNIQRFFYRRMFSALCDCLQNASPLVQAICLGHDPVQGTNGNQSTPGNSNSR